MKQFLSIIAILFLFTGCSNPMNEKITKDNYQEIMDKIKKNSSSEDQQKVMAVVLMSQMGGVFSGIDNVSLLEGKSFNDHIKIFGERIEKEAAEAKEKAIAQAKEKEERAKLEAIENEKNLKNRSMFELLVTKKELDSDAYGIRNWVTLKINVKNSSESDIEAFEGWVEVSDKLDNKLADFYFKNLKLLKKGSSKVIEAVREVKSYGDDNVSAVKYADIEDLKFNFKIEKVIVK